MANATEELRRLLDERGVEWRASDTYRLFVTSWKDVDGHGWTFVEHRDGSFGKLTTYHITPAQAIEATLGRGECCIKPWRMEPDTGFFDCMECDSCGHVMDNSEWSRANYCPNCGRRVV